MSREDRLRWNRKWSERSGPAVASGLLRRNRALLGAGCALDIACGQGQNSVWLARHGYYTLGVDISAVALRKARARAARLGVWRHTLFVQADLDCWRPAPASVDIVVIFRFLDRELYPYLKECIRPGGLLFYETRHEGICRRMPEATREYLLRPGELAAEFAGWEILSYMEGSENAALVARRPRM